MASPFSQPESFSLGAGSPTPRLWAAAPHATRAVATALATKVRRVIGGVVEPGSGVGNGGRAPDAGGESVIQGRPPDGPGLFATGKTYGSGVRIAAAGTSAVAAASLGGGNPYGQRWWSASTEATDAVRF